MPLDKMLWTKCVWFLFSFREVLLLQADREHPQVGKLVWAIEGSLEFFFAPIPLDPLCPSPFLLHLMDVPSAPANCLLSLDWYFQKQSSQGWCPSKGGRPDPSCTVHHYTQLFSCFLLQRLLLVARGGGAFLNKVLLRKAESNKEQTRLYLYSTFS